MDPPVWVYFWAASSLHARHLGVPCSLASAQAGNIVGHRLDFAIVHLSSDVLHLRAVLANTITEGLELLDGVVRMLSRQTRVLHRNAGAIGAVAAHAGSHLAVGNAAAV